MSDVLAPRPEEAAAVAPSDESSSNGHEPDSFEAKLLVDLDGAIREKRERVIALEAEVERVRKQLVEVRAVLKRWEEMRRRLVGEPLRAGRSSKPGPRSSPFVTARGRTGTRLGPDRLAQVKEAISRFAETHDEFAQVDIRSLPDASITHSGGIATAFETLRQEGFIRLARVDGNRKLYRLTRSAVSDK